MKTVKTWLSNASNAGKKPVEIRINIKRIGNHTRAHTYTFFKNISLLRNRLKLVYTQNNIMFVMRTLTMSKIAIKYEPFRTFEHPKQQLESAIGLKTRNTHDYNTVENNYYSINTVLLNSNNKKQLRTTCKRRVHARPRAERK